MVHFVNFISALLKFLFKRPNSSDLGVGQTTHMLYAVAACFLAAAFLVLTIIVAMSAL